MKRTPLTTARELDRAAFVTEASVLLYSAAFAHKPAMDTRTRNRTMVDAIDSAIVLYDKLAVRGFRP